MDFEDVKHLVARWCTNSQDSTRPNDKEKAEALKRLKSYGKLSEQNVEFISNAIWDEVASRNSIVCFPVSYTFGLGNNDFEDGLKGKKLSRMPSSRPQDTP
jgi:hypothetical protein